MPFPEQWLMQLRFLQLARESKGILHVVERVAEDTPTRARNSWCWIAWMPRTLAKLCALK
jgi:hypothetical protein